ncbi:hypothetical protein ACHAWF_012596 [Thalassiosira exigua]
MLSPVDALFTLRPREISRTGSSGKNSIRGSNLSGVTGVCFVRDPALRHGFDYSARRNICADKEIDACGEDDSSDEESSDDDSPLHFRCSNLLLEPKQNTRTLNLVNTDATSECGSQRVDVRHHASHLSAGSYSSLSGVVLASCHLDGSCKLWDLASRRCIMHDICNGQRSGAGLTLRRLDIAGGNNSHKFLYQTRDPSGTVSLHDLERPLTPLLQLHTHSTSFCALSPCQTGAHCHSGTTMGGEANLVALPGADHSEAFVRDLRCDPSGNPACRVALGGRHIGTMFGSRGKYGMLTSLALCVENTSRRIVLGCGMESGTAIFYDLGASGKGHDPLSVQPGARAVKDDSWTSDAISIDLTNASSGATLDEKSQYMCCVELGKDPVLSLDLACSSSTFRRPDHAGQSCEVSGTNDKGYISNSVEHKSTVLAVGGCAGDADELSELPEQQQGTISTIKVKLALDSPKKDSNGCDMSANIRSRKRTCSVASGGKVGVSVCRFRPDGRIYAIGGWDCRLRLFGRTSSKPLTILRHEESVASMDWAGSASLSGLLATGAKNMCMEGIPPY